MCDISGSFDLTNGHLDVIEKEKEFDRLVVGIKIPISSLFYLRRRKTMIEEAVKLF